MKVFRVSPKTGKRNSMELDITLDQLRRWQEGELIQHVMPGLTPDEREFLMSGLTPTEWADLFPEEDEDA